MTSDNEPWLEQLQRAVEAAAGRAFEQVDEAGAGRAFEEQADTAGASCAFEEQADTAAGAVEAVGAALDMVQPVVEQAVARCSAAEQPACQAGCYFCCYAPVQVSWPEAVTIAEYLQGVLSEAALEVLLDALDEHARRTDGLSITERYHHGLPCPFLDERRGLCSIYPVRPLRCRGANSVDATACERGCREGDVDIDVNVLMYDGYRAATYGLERAARGAGRTARRERLSQAVGRALRRPEAASRGKRGASNGG